MREYTLVNSLSNDHLLHLVTGELGGDDGGDGDQDQGGGEGGQQPTAERHAHPAPARPPVKRVKTLLLLVDHDTVQTKQRQSEK